jgi:hypothetical protein
MLASDYYILNGVLQHQFHVYYSITTETTKDKPVPKYRTH